jgi:hypothetical protein
MKIFLSWSGVRSEACARLFSEWLPLVIQSVRTWVASEDIDKGTRWATQIATELESSDFGVVFVTPSNRHKDWLLFEAGALSKKVSDGRVCTVLLDLGPTDVTGPLSQFQATRLEESDVLRLVETINKGLPFPLTPAVLTQSFRAHWPSLAERGKALPPDPDTATEPARSEKNLLEEILSLTRAQNRFSRRTPDDSLLYSFRFKAIQSALEKAIEERGFASNKTHFIKSFEGGYHEVIKVLAEGKTWRFEIPREIGPNEVLPYFRDMLSNGMATTEVA